MNGGVTGECNGRFTGGASRARGRMKFLLLVTLLAMGCHRPDRSSGRPVVIAFESSPSHPDPRLGTDQASERLADMAFRGLVRRSGGGGVITDLASSWHWENPSTLVVEIRPGQTFVDGRPLAARDVVWTFQSLLDPATGSPRRGAFARLDPDHPVESRGEGVVVFRCLKLEPCSGLLQNLNLGIVPAGARPADVLARPIGAGPMRITAMIPDERTVLEASKAGGKAGIELRVIPDATSRALSLLEGSVDLAVNNLSPDLVQRFREDSRFRVADSPGSNYAYLGFNCADPALGDRRVRQAVALAIDRRALVEHLHRGLGDLTETALPPANLDRAVDLPVLTPDLEEARRLLDEAGWPSKNGASRLRLVYKTSTDETAVLQATAIQWMLARIGIEITVRPLDFGAFYADVQRGAVQLYSLVWTSVSDPDLLRMIFHSAMVPPAGWNRGRFSNPLLDRILDDAASLPPGDDRRELYIRAQRIVREDLPYVSLWHRRNVAVYRAGLAGVTIDVLGDFRFVENLERIPGAP